MRVTVLFFARIKETLGIASEQVQITPELGVKNVDDLIKHLSSRGEKWQSEFGGSKQIRAAVNFNLITDTGTAISDGDEVAFFPPITGG